MNDDELLDLLRREPERGLALTVGQYSAYVYKIASAKLNDTCTKEDIEEAVSDTFYIFFKSGQKCGFRIRSVRAMLSVIAKRHCINIFYKQSRQPETIGYDEIENLISDDEDTDAELICAIKQLGEPDSSIFVRKYYLGQKNIDIAKDLDMNINTLNTRLSRGLVKLRKILEEGM